MPEFGTYEGRPVRKSSIKIKGLGDGLSDALAIEPRDFQPGDIAYVVLEVVAGDKNHKYMQDADSWNLIQVTTAQRGAFIDAAVAKPILDGVTVAVEEMREEETGQSRLGARDERITEHKNGLHKKKRAGCPICHPLTDEDYALVDEYDSVGAQHGDGEGDNVSPLPAARRRRTKPKA